MHRSSVAVVLALLVMVSLASAGLAAPYGVSTNNDVNVPAQTVDIDGSSYQIDAVGKVSKGDEITATVSVDGNQDYNLDLYNRDEQVEDFRDGTGDGTVTFPTANLEPGTYALALQVDGSVQAIHPVVVSEYSLSVAAPADATVGEPFDVSIEVGEQVAPDETVEVGIYKDGTEIRRTATHTGGGTYVATVDPGATGDWVVYGAVRADGEAAGYPTSTGIANGQIVTIENDGGNGDDGGTTDGGSGDNGGSTDGGSSDDGAGDGDDGSSDDGGGQTDDGNTTDDGSSTDDGSGSDDGNSSDEGSTNDGSDGSEDGTDDGTSDETDGDTDDGSDDGDGADDGPMDPNDPDSTGSESDTATDDDDGSQDDTLALSWLVPIVAAVLAVAALQRN
ncbi:hypothetical protein [Salinarchaeum laminariae]|uniref:hypothetical protein n=1 Tax=Salinarchaeum laminariae TaxID=869888 RepID=UPI0020BE96EF|nr:hypothetical protein [Salinarchaeum laminariae]